MRRDYFTLEVDGIEWVDGDGEPSTPTLRVDYTGPVEDLRPRLVGADGNLLDADGTDVAFRLLAPLDVDDVTGVVSLTDRVTGEFVLELNARTDTIIRFVRAARRYGEDAGADDGRYAIRVSVDGEELVAYEKSALLVYDTEGELLRQHSLIPSGVEI